MKYWIKTEQIGENKAKISTMINADYLESEGISSLEQSLGIIYDETQVPIIAEISGKDAIMYQNIETKELFVEYFDRPLTTDEKRDKAIADLEAYNANLEYTLMMAGVI